MFTIMVGIKRGADDNMAALNEAKVKMSGQFYQDTRDTMLGLL